MPTHVFFGHGIPLTPKADSAIPTHFPPLLFGEGIPQGLSSHAMRRRTVTTGGRGLAYALMLSPIIPLAPGFGPLVRDLVQALDPVALNTQGVSLDELMGLSTFLWGRLVNTYLFPLS